MGILNKKVLTSEEKYGIIVMSETIFSSWFN